MRFELFDHKTSYITHLLQLYNSLSYKLMILSNLGTQFYVKHCNINHTKLTKKKIYDKISNFYIFRQN